jgi:uncharacterized protein
MARHAESCHPGRRWMDWSAKAGHLWSMHRRVVLGGLLVAGLVGPAYAEVTPALRLVAAARSQVGVTTVYDPAYAVLDFPGGDVDRARGVCTDVVIRAFRDGLGIDLQRAVNRDMKAAFGKYPQNWGLARPDRNIDHRRVGNLRRLFERVGAEVTASGPFLAGDIVSVMLPGNLPHVMILSDLAGASGQPMVLHNIGAGAREEDRLGEYPMTGHYRLTPGALQRLSALG